jgi:hypothetical protein
MMGVKVQWNGYAELRITVPVHLKPQIPKT